MLVGKVDAIERKADCFFVEIEKAKHVTLYVKARPLISVKSGIAFPRKEK